MSLIRCVYSCDRTQSGDCSDKRKRRDAIEDGGEAPNLRCTTEAAIATDASINSEHVIIRPIQTGEEAIASTETCNRGSDRLVMGYVAFKAVIAVIKSVMN